MFVCVVCLTYTAFTRDETRGWNNNVYTGLIGVTIFFMIISILTLPNGPFTRPHPSIWRCILAIAKSRVTIGSIKKTSIGISLSISISSGKSSTANHKSNLD